MKKIIVAILFLISSVAFSLSNFEYKTSKEYVELKVRANGVDYKYYLVKDISKFNLDLKKNEFVVKVPIKRAVFMNSTILSAVEMLEEVNSIVGLDGYWTTIDSIKKLIASGKIAKVGELGSIDKERLLMIAPEVIFCNLYSGSIDELNFLQEKKIIPVVMADWEESSLLERLDWLLFLSCFYEKENLANTIITKIKYDFYKISDGIKHDKAEKKIIFNLPSNGAWYMPGGNSYLINIFKFFNFKYLFNTDKKQNQLLDLETVFAKGSSADIWIIHNGSFKDKEDFFKNLSKYDSRLINFLPIKKAKIYVNDKLLDENGYNGYFDYFAFKPDRVLLDIKNIVEDSSDLYFYRELK